MSSQIHIERQGRVLVAKLDNPPHAFVTMRMVAELDALVRSVEDDPDVGAVIITGTHPQRFLAHFDVSEILAQAQSAPAVSASLAAVTIRLVGALRRIPGMSALLQKTPLAGVLTGMQFHDMLLRIGRSKVAYIAAINGHAQGGGCELALACDFRIMVDAPAAIGQPEVLLGFPPGAGGSQRLARLIGRAQALELCLEGVPLMPNAALRIGLINQVVPIDRLMPEAMQLAQRMARRSKPAVGAIKQAILEGGSLPLEAGMHAEQAQFMHTVTTPQAKRAMASYVKRVSDGGEAPIYDVECQSDLIDGRFVDMTSS